MKNVTFDDDAAGVDIDELNELAENNPNCSFFVGRWQLTVKGSLFCLFSLMSSEELTESDLLEGIITNTSYELDKDDQNMGEIFITHG